MDHKLIDIDYVVKIILNHNNSNIHKHVYNTIELYHSNTIALCHNNGNK